MSKPLTYILILALGLAACGKKAPDTPEAKKAELDKLKKEQSVLQGKIRTLESELKMSDTASGRQELITVVQPESKTFKHYVEVQGKVESDQNANVSAKVPSTITAINVQRGDHVTAGQVMIQLDDAMVRQGIAEVKNGWELANTVYQKQKNLWDQKIGTEIQYLSAKNNKDALEKKMATLQEQLDMYKIRAPFSGTVDEVTPKLGESSVPGMPLVRVVNFDKMKVTAEVAESYASQVNKGDEVKVFFPDLKKEITTNVRVVSQAINAINRTFTIELGLPNNAANMRPNMIAVVKINDYSNKSALVVPLNAVQKDENGAYLYVAQQNGKNWIAKKKQVELGSNYNGEAEIIKGLSHDDKVISGGYQNVTEGQAVEISAQTEIENKK